MRQVHELDLAVEVFLAVRDVLMPGGRPGVLRLKEKGKPQDDVFAGLLADAVRGRLAGSDRFAVLQAGSNTNPDFAVASLPELAELGRGEVAATGVCVAIEVKRTERDASGRVAGIGGTEFNSTPPCSTVTLFDAAHEALHVPGFYLVSCVTPVPDTNVDGEQDWLCSGFALADGTVLNTDVELYAAATGTRTKKLGLGSFADGIDRDRPFHVFPNVLSFAELDGAATLLHRDVGLGAGGLYEGVLSQTGLISRTAPEAQARARVACYRASADVDAAVELFDVVDPFRVPERKAETSQRGRFVVPVQRGQALLW